MCDVSLSSFGLYWPRRNLFRTISMLCLFPLPREDLGQSILEDMAIVIDQSLFILSLVVLDMGDKAQVPLTNQCQLRPF